MFFAHFMGGFDVRHCGVIKFTHTGPFFVSLADEINRLTWCCVAKDDGQSLV